MRRVLPAALLISLLLPLGVLASEPEPTSAGPVQLGLVFKYLYTYRERDTNTGVEGVSEAGLRWIELDVHGETGPELGYSIEPLRLIRDKVECGELGAKAGKGFYNWSPEQTREFIRRRDEALLVLLGWLTQSGYLCPQSE